MATLNLGTRWRSVANFTPLPLYICAKPFASRGARGSVVVKALRYKPMVSLEFFSDIILSVALWPWGRLSL